ncbi:hypothetical protein KI387_002455, partial [Taxus chinensis]
MNGYSISEKAEGIHRRHTGHTLVCPLFEFFHQPESHSTVLDFYLGWWLDPLTYGEYPTTMRTHVGDRLPYFTKEESELVKGSFDFLGMNYYTAMYAINNNATPSAQPIDFNDDTRVNLTSVKNGVLIGPQAGSTWLHVYPRGIRALLNFIKVRYNNPTIYITEN